MSRIKNLPPDSPNRKLVERAVAYGRTAAWSGPLKLGGSLTFLGSIANIYAEAHQDVNNILSYSNLEQFGGAIVSAGLIALGFVSEYEARKDLEAALLQSEQPQAETQITEE